MDTLIDPVVAVRRAALAVALTAAVAVAQPRPEVVLGRNDAEFARALQLANYPDLCAVVLDMMKATGAASGPSVEAALLGIKMTESRNEEDTAKRKSILVGIAKDTEAFIQRYPTSPEAADLRNNLPLVYQTLAETLAAEIESVKADVQKSADLRQEGKAIFQQAEESLSARVAATKQELDAAAAAETEPSEDKIVEHMVSALSLARIRYFHSLIEAPKSYERQKVLESALEQLQEFDLDYEERLMNVEARVFQALCLRDLGRSDEAIDILNSAIAAREAYGRDGNGPWKLPPEAADYLSVAARQKVVILAQDGRFDEAIEAANDFLTTTPNALEAAQGKAVLLELADAQGHTDPKAAAETAKRLIDADPRGYWGYRARLLAGELLRSGGADQSEMSPVGLLGIAETLANGADPLKAVPVCMKVIDAIRGTDVEAKLGCEAYLIVGAAYAKQNRFHEAATAFDAGHESYPNAEKAPEVLWRAINCYIEINGDEKNPFYKKRIEERMTKLAAKYPTHPHAASAQLVEARELEAARDFEKAADLYLKVRPGSFAHFEARFRAANCYFRHARKLFTAKQDGKPFVAKAEATYQALRTDLKKAIDETLDAQLQQRMHAMAFDSLMSLAGLNLQPENSRPDEVLKLLDSVDPVYSNDPERSTQIWEYRIRALQAQGKVDDAIGLLEALVAKGAADTTIAGPAGMVAGHLDKRAADLAKGQKRPPPKAVDLWRKAALFYGMAVAPQLSGKLPLRATDANAIATRLFAIGLVVNGVPEGVDSFTGLEKFEARETKIWEQAAAVQEAVLAQIPSVQAAVGLGRIHGLLQRWKEAATVYSRLFAEEQMVDPTTDDINKETVTAKPALLLAYLEWGVVAYQLGKSTPGSDELRRSLEILRRVGAYADRGSMLWWRGRYWTIKALIANGTYKEAKILMNGLERSFNNFDDNKYGMAELFRALKPEIK